MSTDKKKSRLPGLLNNSSKKSEKDSCSTDDEETNHLIQSSSPPSDNVKRKTSMGRLLKREHSNGASKTSESTDYEQLKEATTTSNSMKMKWASTPSVSKKKLLEEEVARLEQQFLASANERLNAHEKRITMLEARIKKQDEQIEDLLGYTRELRQTVAQLQHNNSEGGCMSFDWFS